MSAETERTTIYLDSGLRRALKIKAATAGRSVSDLVNEAVRRTLEEDREDLAAFESRVAEPTMTYEALLDDLKSHGKL